MVCLPPVAARAAAVMGRRAAAKERNPRYPGSLQDQADMARLAHRIPDALWGPYHLVGGPWCPAQEDMIQWFTREVDQ